MTSDFVESTQQPQYLELLDKKYLTLPHCLSYHPQSELLSRSGYYPNLTPSQLQAASDLYTLLYNDNLIEKFNYDEENEYLKILRFLRARKYSVQLSYEMIKEDIKWRLEDNRMNLRCEKAEDVLGCDLGAIYRCKSSSSSSFNAPLFLLSP